MKLFYSGTSPYSRKVRLVIHEKGLTQAITCVACNPFENAPDLEANNPLCKIPTLILEDRTPLYDSPVICEYLDTLTADWLLPASGMARWSVLRWQALCASRIEPPTAWFVDTPHGPPDYMKLKSNPDY